jgi:Icc-related predicted phosphoesterase
MLHSKTMQGGIDVFVSHVPPVTTNLDATYGGFHAGSRAVRAYIEGFQPTLSLHGHIHESPQVSGSVCDRIGRTLCVNPGQTPTQLSAVRWSSDRSDTAEQLTK